MKYSADLTVVFVLLILSLLAFVEARYGFGAMNTGAAIFPLLTALGLTAATTVIFIGQIKNRQQTTSKLSANRAVDSSELAALLWICGLSLALIIGGVLIGGILSISAYMRYKLNCTWIKSLAFALVSCVVIPVMLRKILGISIPGGVWFL